MQRLLAVVNGNAGTADDASVRAALAELRGGADVELASTTDAQELRAVLAARDGRRVVVVGGDGSVHAAVAALDALGALNPADPVAIVPRGTGNDLARTLGLPLDPVDAAAAVLAGRPRPVDLLRDDDGGIVVNSAHAGVGARASAEALRFKDRLGSTAYPLGAAIAGLTSSDVRLTVEIDGEVAVHEVGGWTADGGTDVLMLGVCNGPTIAGGTPLAPGALVDDGLADVVVCTATGPVARAAFAAALLSGAHVDRPDVLSVRARSVRIHGEPVDVVADGELKQAVGARTWRVDPGAWSVIVPR